MSLQKGVALFGFLGWVATAMLLPATCSLERVQSTLFDEIARWRHFYGTAAPVALLHEESVIALAPRVRALLIAPVVYLNRGELPVNALGPKRDAAIAAQSSQSRHEPPVWGQGDHFRAIGRAAERTLTLPYAQSAFALVNLTVLRAVGLFYESLVLAPLLALTILNARLERRARLSIMKNAQPWVWAASAVALHALGWICAILMLLPAAITGVLALVPLAALVLLNLMLSRGGELHAP